MWYAQPMVLHIPIGLPGSGKSTWTKFYLRGAYHVSSDAIREEMHGTYHHDTALNPIVFDEFYRRIRSRLTFDGDVVADATNLGAKYRVNLLNIAEETGSTVSYIVFTNTVQAIIRNAQRQPPRRVPDDVMAAFVGKYEMALTEIPTEPYHHITYIKDSS